MHKPWISVVDIVIDVFKYVTTYAFESCYKKMRMYLKDSISIADDKMRGKARPDLVHFLSLIISWFTASFAQLSNQTVE